jgi:hypothetical protein
MKNIFLMPYLLLVIFIQESHAESLSTMSDRMIQDSAAIRGDTVRGYPGGTTSRGTATPYSPGEIDLRTQTQPFIRQHPDMFFEQQKAKGEELKLKQILKSVDSLKFETRNTDVKKEVFSLPELGGHKVLDSKRSQTFESSSFEF